MRKRLLMLVGALSACVLLVNHASAAQPKDEMYKIELKRAVIDTQAKEKTLTAKGLTAEGKGFYIIQFAGPVEESWKEALKQKGVKFYSYLPQNAFIVKLDPSLHSSVIFSPGVQYVGPYEPAYKVSPSLDDTIAGKIKEAAFSTKAAVPPAVELKVKVFDGENMRPVIARIESLGGKVDVLMDGPGLNEKKLKVTLPAVNAASVASIPEVEWVEEYKYARLCNDVAKQTIAVKAAHDFKSRPLNGRGQVVGLLDTGLDTGNTNTLHAAFMGKAGNGGAKVLGGRSYRSDDNWRDEYGHGTHVAGSMTGGIWSGSNGREGMAPGAQLYVQSGQSFAEYMISPDLQTVFIDAYHAGVRVHNNSWGLMHGKLGEYDINCQDVDTYTYSHRDFLPVFAAGNEGVDRYNNYSSDPSGTKADGIVDRGSLMPPGTSKNCITVGATESDKPGITTTTYGVWRAVMASYSTIWPVNPIHDDNMADNPADVAAFSSRGPTADGRIKPDLVAPGTYVESSWTSLPSLSPDTYELLSGTSMASPIVAGTAALVRQYYMDMRGDKHPSASLIKATLINGATDLSSYYASEISFYRPDFHQGWGRVNLMNSVYPGQSGASSPSPAKVLDFVDNKKGLMRTNTGMSYTFRISPEGVGLPVRVTLVWADYPGSPAAASELVNDLDLTVISPDGGTYTSGFLNLDEPNAPWYKLGLYYDYQNNVESVEFTPSTWGTFLVNVQGANIPNGPQPYAIVVTGGLEVPRYTISGVVLDAYKSPVAGMRVIATGPVLADVTTASDGTFTIPGVTQGNYYFNVYDASGATLLSAKPDRLVKVHGKDVSKVTLVAP